ncbi:maleylacetoacetate isomerase [Achlya hypogyna]|uniref:Maleylacetoacetate isomerase n=1 Tax=Achlya hypogyna TaxID=1202772 RepID=A0A1V9YPV1_ACHHY|nr:maleylacetoacetate isomerase [Achlya hypogyna]
MSRPVLYSFWKSSASYRVRIALAWKGIEYDYRAVDIFRRENESREYQALNMNQKVPTLLIDGKVLTQSPAILEYLEETRPARPLLPADPYVRAQIRALCGIIGADIQPLQNMAVLREVARDAESKETRKLQWAQHWIERGFIAVEGMLEDSAGTYCFGDDITMADLFLLPQANNAKAFHVDMTQFPNITRVTDSLQSVPEFVVAHPVHMPDKNSASFRTRIGLAWKGIDYDYRAVNLQTNENFGAAYTRLNPSSKVPTLLIDGIAFTQSAAILEYLDETRPAKPLFPVDAMGRAKVRAFCGMIGADIQPLQNLATLRKVAALVPEADAESAKLAWVDHWVTRGFTAVEAVLRDSAGAYCFGDTVSMADVYLYPQVFNANFYGVDLSKFPNIERIAATLAKEPAFIAADPYSMPDRPQASCSFRVRIGLNLKGIEYTYRAITDPDDDDYCRLNPSKKVPTLVIDDDVFTQSEAILEYLDDTRPAPPLLPADARLRAKVRAFCMIIGADIQPLQNGAVLEELGELVGDANKEATTDAWVRHWMLRGFDALEAMLAKHAGTYAFGDSVTLADVFLYPQVFNARFYGVSLDAYPLIARVAAALAELPAFTAADPHKMPDAPATP